jgi:PilZ domain
MSAALQSKSAVIFALDRRSKDRIDVALWSWIRAEDEEDQPIRITNVSLAGLSGMTPLKLASDQMVRLCLPDIGWVAAKTCWVMGDRVGFEFNLLIEDESFDKLLKFAL